MLNSISWSVFLTAITLLIAVYYAVSSVLYYRHEISNLFRRKNLPDSNIISNRVVADHPLMGTTKPEAPKIIRKQSVSTEELLFAPPPIKETPTSDSDPIIIGTIADLLQESKDLAKSMAETTTSKEECASLFQALLERYPQLNNSTYKDAISISLFHTCKTELGISCTLEEISSWWPNQTSNN